MAAIFDSAVVLILAYNYLQVLKLFLSDSLFHSSKLLTGFCCPRDRMQNSSRPENSRLCTVTNFILSPIIKLRAFFFHNHFQNMVKYYLKKWSAKAGRFLPIRGEKLIRGFHSSRSAPNDIAYEIETRDLIWQRKDLF
ncbi:MAG: hypothetical protein ACLUAR_03645 [Pilosibacter sp.]